MMTPAQCRAARALIRWTQDDLAAATKGGVSAVSIRQFEAEKTTPRQLTVEALQAALEGAGVVFTDRGVELAS